MLQTSIRGQKGSVSGDNSTEPMYANWEYRIAVAPLDRDIKLCNFRLSDDMATIMGGSNRPLTALDMENSRKSRFKLNGWQRDDCAWRRGRFDSGLLDELMAQVPGRNGYGAFLYDDTFGLNATNFKQDGVLNTNYYSRHYSVGGDDAMGRANFRRTPNDNNMFAAMTTQERVAPVEACSAEMTGSGTSTKCDDSNRISQRWSYATPLELIYLTPLTSWNPHNFEYCPESLTSEACSKVRTGPSGDRTGGLTPETAYNGLTRSTYFTTPEGFFGGGNDYVDPADTSGGVTGVLDRQGKLQRVRASGTWIHLPQMKGFGEQKVRLRYPIFTTYEEGSTTFKELKAFQAMLRGESTGGASAAAMETIREERYGVDLVMGEGSGHTHTIKLLPAQLREMDDGAAVKTTSSTANGHSHEVYVTRIKYEMRPGEPTKEYKVTQCDAGLKGKAGVPTGWTGTCGNRTGFADTNAAILELAQATESLWAAYTDPVTHYSVDSDGNGRWLDASGNSRHASGLAGPILRDVEYESPGVVVNYRQGFSFPEGSIPDQFTICARARFALNRNDPSTRLADHQILKDGDKTTNDWVLGWDWAIGRAKFGGAQVDAGGRRDSPADKYAFRLICAKNELADAALGRHPLFVDGDAVAATAAGYAGPGSSGDGRLTINLGDGQNGYASDCELSELFIFDAHLDDDTIGALSDLVVERPERARPCCADMHMGVRVATSSDL